MGIEVHELYGVAALFVCVCACQKSKILVLEQYGYLILSIAMFELAGEILFISTETGQKMRKVMIFLEEAQEFSFAFVRP